MDLGVAEERLELPTSTVNHCVLPILIATLLQHLAGFNKKYLPDFKGGYLSLQQYAAILGIFALFSSEIAYFLWS